MRTGRRAQQIMGVCKAGAPVAQGLVDRILECLAAAGHRYHLGAHQLHAEHVEPLPLDVLRAHVDSRFEAEQRADNRSRHAVLTSARLGNQPALPHAPGQQRLTKHLVGLVSTAVQQILALQVDAPRSADQVPAACKWRRPAGVSGKKLIEL